MSRCGGNCGNHRCPRSAWVLSSRRPVHGGAPALAPLGIASVDPMLPTELSTIGALSNDKRAHSHPQALALHRGGPTLVTHAWRACCLIRLVSSVTWL